MTGEIEAFSVTLPRAGLQVHGLQAGHAGVPLLLLHGWPEWSHAWRPVMSRLAPRFEIIAPDLRGFGDTAPPALAASREAGPDRHAQDLLELADLRGWSRFGVVSHDVGSLVAQHLARLAPERIAGLFFFNCVHAGIGARWVAPRRLGEIWYHAFHQLPWTAELVGSSRDACRIYLRHFLTHWSHQREWVDAALETWVDHFMKPGRLQGGFNWYASVHEARLAMMEGRTPPAPPIAAPARVLWGAHDPVLDPAWTDRLGETFSEVEVGLQPDAGHFVHLEQPDAAAASIEAFFDGITPR